MHALKLRYYLSSGPRTVYKHRIHKYAQALNNHIYIIYFIYITYIYVYACMYYTYLAEEYL